MTRWLEAAQVAERIGTKPTKLTEPHPNGGHAGVSSVLSVSSEWSEVQSDGTSIATFERDTANIASAADPYAGMFVHGTSTGGRPRTWTGRVVSFTEWRKLSVWQRDGPDGRMFCGCCWQWLTPKIAQAHAEAARKEWIARE